VGEHLLRAVGLGVGLLLDRVPQGREAAGGAEAVIALGQDARAELELPQDLGAAALVVVVEADQRDAGRGDAP
jgi:hypothetical protein